MSSPYLPPPQPPTSFSDGIIPMPLPPPSAPPPSAAAPPPPPPVPSTSAFAQPRSPPPPPPPPPFGGSINASSAASKVNEILVAFGRATRMAGAAHVMDVRSRGILVWVAALRFMVLWVMLFAADKIFQSAYIDRGLNTSDPKKKLEKPLPSLWTIMPMVLLCEALFFGILLVLLWTLRAMYANTGSTGATFVVDADLISRVLYSYLLSTAVLLFLGGCMGNIVQCRKEFRYDEDGMRGIRALCTLLLPTALIVLAVATLVAMLT